MNTNIKITEEHERVLKYLSEYNDKSGENDDQSASQIANALQTTPTKVEVWLSELETEGLISHSSNVYAGCAVYSIDPKGGRYLMDKGLI